MRRALWFGIAAICALFVFRFVRSATRSPEERIRALVESMAEGFNEESPRRAVRGLDDEWRDADQDLDRERLSGGLWLYFRERGERGARVELPPEELIVDFDPSLPQEGRVTGLARFHERRGGAEQLVWELEFDCRLALIDGSWRIVESERRTRSGRRP